MKKKTNERKRGRKIENKLRVTRRERGMTQRELVEAVKERFPGKYDDLSDGLLSRMENGLFLPSPDLASAFATCLQVDFGTIWSERDYMVFPRAPTEKDRERMICEKAVKIFGIEHQAIIWIEELSELQKAITKFLRSDAVNREALDPIREEAADVMICLAQMDYAFRLEDKVRQNKIDRLDRRIEDYLRDHPEAAPE